MEIPREQRGGCITSYTIYLENGSGDRQACKNHLSEVLLFYYNTLHTEVMVCTLHANSHESLRWCLSINVCFRLYTSIREDTYNQRPVASYIQPVGDRFNCYRRRPSRSKVEGQVLYTT